MTGPPDTAVDGIDTDHDGADGPVTLLDEVTDWRVGSDELEQLGYTVACAQGSMGGRRRAVVVGTWDDSESPLGRTYLLDGEVDGTGVAMDDAWLRIEGANNDELGRWSLLLPGDLNGDAQGDLLLADLNDAVPARYTGSIYAFDPVATGFVGPSDAFARFVGASGGSQLGGMAAAGDVDLDGVPDLWLAETTWTDVTSSGVLRLYSGRDARGTVPPEAALSRSAARTRAPRRGCTGRGWRTSPATGRPTSSPESSSGQGTRAGSGGCSWRPGRCSTCRRTP